MRYLITLFLGLSAALTAACPDSVGYPKTCFVSTLGSDTLGDGTIAAPFASIQTAENTSSPGDTILLRQGRYTSDVNYLAPTKTGTPAAPISIRAFQGEAVIIQGSIGRRFFTMLPSNTYGSWHHFIGLRFEKWDWDSTWPVLVQGNHPGIQFKAIRAEVQKGFAIINPHIDGTGYKVLGSHFNIAKDAQCRVNDTGNDDNYSGTCPPNTSTVLLGTQTPNANANWGDEDGCRLDIGDGYGNREITYQGGGVPGSGVLAGSGHSFYLKLNATASPQRWEIYSVTPFDCTAWVDTATGYVGCDGLTMQDVVWDRDGAAGDFIGGESGTGGSVAKGGIVFSRTSIISSPAQNDCFDSKATGITLSWVEVRGPCTAKGIGAWGYSYWRNVRTNGPSFIGGDYNGRDVHNATDDGGFIRISAPYLPTGGEAPNPGQRVTITGVLGCTGANGTFRIKDGKSRDEFRIMTDAGGNTYCGGTYTSSPSSTVYHAPPLVGPAADIRYATLKTPGGSIGMWGPPNAGTWKLYDSILADDSTGSGITVDSHNVTIRQSDRNLLWNGRGQVYATSYTDAPGATYGDGHLLGTAEPNSVFANPYIDATTLRATASTPTSAWNKGYYAGTNTVSSGTTTQIVRFRAPQAMDDCTITLDNDANFSSPVETITSTVKELWRNITFGLSTPLATGTTYHHKIQCGYEVFTGSGATKSSASGTAPLRVTLSAPISSLTYATLDYSTDGGSTWVVGAVTDCTTGCSLSTAALPKGYTYHVRTRRTNSGDTQSVPSAVIPLAL